MNDFLDMLAKAGAATSRIVGGVRLDQLTAATPCTEMDVRALLNHLVNGTHVFASVVDGVPFDYAAAADVTAGDFPAAYDAAVQRAMDAWSAPGVFDHDYDLPFGRMPAPVALGTTLLETVVHGWDLAHATGQVLDLDPSIPEQLLATARMMLPPTGRGDEVPFDDAVVIDDEAPPLDRLAAYLGRRP